MSADTIDYMDNISIKWLPDNLYTEATGAHNGGNYIAYNFYVVNNGTETIYYWYEIDIDDTVRNVDEVIRFMIFLMENKLFMPRKVKLQIKLNMEQRCLKQIQLLSLNKGEILSLNKKIDLLLSFF